MANEQVIPTVGKAELNSEIKVEINTTPTGESATYSDMRKAFKSVTDRKSTRLNSSHTN